ncbi:MAG TPA: serine hydrolase [Casimicrobiaceae bacterium]
MNDGMVARATMIVLAVALAAPARAAPDEAELGKAEGYPACPPTLYIEMRCVVGLVTKRDETYAARKVPKGERVQALARAEREPSIAYRYAQESGGLDTYLDNTHTTGVLIVKDGTILAERYQYGATPASRMTSFSMGKTVTAMLVGIAVAEGAIASIDDRADKYVPELRGTLYGETRIRHLLTMSSGIRFVETYSGSDDIATLALLSLLGNSDGGAATLVPFTTRERPAGERFHYSSADTQALGLVLRAATGRTLADYLSEKIWKPMGAEADASWLVDKGGYEIAYAGVNATLRDWGRFGMLLADGGVAGGRQVIPSAWIRDATRPAGKGFYPGDHGLFFGYGYQTWIMPGEGRQFVLRGLRRQFVFVDPDAKLVMVSTAAENVAGGNGEQLALWNALTRTLAPRR